MRIICVGSYRLTANIITNLARICPWSRTHHFLEKLSHLQRVKSSPSHKSAVCVTGIDEPPNSGVAGAAIIPHKSIEDGLLQRALCVSLQTGHQPGAIQIATSKWKSAS